MSVHPIAWIEKLLRLSKRMRYAILALLHVFFFALAYVGAFLIRFDFQVGSVHEAMMWRGLPMILAIKVGVFASMQMFQGWWKYVSFYDLVALARALAISGAVFMAINIFLVSPVGFPRSIYVLDYVLALFFIGGARGSMRVFREFAHNRVTADRPAVNVLIVGAGDTGETLMREISKNRNLPFRVIGFLDDDSFKHGLRIHGVPVLGAIDRLAFHVEQYAIRQVIIAMPSASRAEIRRVVDAARASKVEARIIPAVEAILEGHVSLERLREVSITDLLGREPVELDTAAIGRFLEGRTILVTGAGGSIGSEICRQVMRFNPKKLILVDAAETPLFFIHRELAELHGDRLEPYVANVTHGDRMEEIFHTHKPEVVLHAAAYKHVPLMELHPCEAVRNNVGGTQVTADLAAKYGAKTFVLISTDKAVNPTSVMGATKRVAELYVRHLNDRHPNTKFCAVRFGNVLGSNGSVIPIFRDQIAKGGPVTVTHPEMTRYFMTIPEATQLVLQAATFKTGDLFILDMGEPVKIVDLARDMIRLSGLTEADVPITFTGMRPGEKLFEELTLDHEDVDTTTHRKIFIGRDPHLDFEALGLTYRALRTSADEGSELGVRRGLKELVPTYEGGDLPENVVPMTGRLGT
jgi:FlaA1/EpsC-like NDP-sugar epimerase